MIYLAVPYSHPDLQVKEARFKAANKAAAHLMRLGHHVFSPISHTHPIALEGDLPGDWGFWKAYDEIMMKACARMIVLTLDGWKESVGVVAEIEIATTLGLPIQYISP